MPRRYGLIFVFSLLLVGCGTSQKQVLATEESQVQLRSIQTRVYDTTDKPRTLRTVIAVLQDLGFVIDKADATLGTVSGTKLDRYRLRMTVTVRPRGQTQMLVRANAQYNLTAVEDPEPYQQFFAALSKGMFLTANEVGADEPAPAPQAASVQTEPVRSADPSSSNAVELREIEHLYEQGLISEQERADMRATVLRRITGDTDSQ